MGVPTRLQRDDVYKALEIHDPLMSTRTYFLIVYTSCGTWLLRESDSQFSVHTMLAKFFLFCLLMISIFDP